MRALRVSIRKLAALAAATTAFAWGCVTEKHTRIGRVCEADLGPGYFAPDFSFVADVADNGSIETFSHVRGVVTIVTFAHEADWPDCDDCGEIADLASRLTTVTTPAGMLCIGTPSASYEHAAAALHQARIEGYAQLIAVCDHRGRAREAYGPHSGGRFFVVDSTGRICATGPLEDRAAMTHALAAAVAEHEQDWAATPGEQ